MDSRNLDGRADDTRFSPADVEDLDGAWSIRKLLELVDGAIDSAGAQLARSAGLWADAPTPFEERGRSVVRRRPRSESTRDLLEGPDGSEGVSLM
jgi:hypothetical protein